MLDKTGQKLEQPQESEEGEALIKGERGEQNPSDAWSRFSDSNLSDHHIPEAEKANVRTSTDFHTFINLSKTFIGIANLVLPKFIADYGIQMAVVGVFILALLNCYCMWLLIKARNRFKRH